jgi:hypothetical protein
MIVKQRNAQHFNDNLPGTGFQRERWPVRADELAVFVDLGVSNARIAHYFGVDQEQVSALRSYYGLSVPGDAAAIGGSKTKWRIRATPTLPSECD